MEKTKKEVCCTTDFVDNILCASGHEHGLLGEDDVRLFSEDDIDALMVYCARMGAKRHEWILGDTNSLYDSDSPLEFDLLKTACSAAHRHGMRFDVVYKPFDGGCANNRRSLPSTLPNPSDAPFIEDETGLIYGVRPFIAEHPEMRLERAPSQIADPGGAIAEIRLIKHGTEPSGLSADDLSIWTSRDNSGHSIDRYQGPIKLRETTEYRPLLIYQDHNCRVLHLEGMELPEDVRFIVIRCKKEGDVNFSDDVNSLTELVSESGDIIPSSLTPGPFDSGAVRRIRMAARCGYDRYLSHPEVKSILENGEEFEEKCHAMNRLRTQCGHSGSTRTAEHYPALEYGSQLVVMRGRPRYYRSALNPTYPEVREHWLERVRFCIESGADSVNIRTQNHNWPVDPWNYGFNPPTLENIHDENTAEAARINGEAYTQFLRDAADVLHGAGKELGVHLYTTMIGSDERPGASHSRALVPRNIDWQWRTWIGEIADYVEFRGAFTMLPNNIRRAVDLIGLAARESGIPFIYQSSRAGGVVSFEGPHHHLSWEIENIVKPHRDIDVYNFYETACFTRFTSDGKLEGSPGMAALAQKLVSDA